MSEFYCVCQSKKGRTGLCDILPEYQKELAETREELALYKKALEKSCWLLSMSSECFNGYCPLDNTISDKRYGFESKHCPDCNKDNVWQEYFLQKAGEENDT